MMKKVFLIAVMLLAGFSASAQDELNTVLTDIEANNATLAALRKLRDAQTIEARVGNSLDDPQVSFGYKWGHNSEPGKSGDFSVSQPFDFPTVYANRNKLAKLQAEQYGYEYLAARQELLLDAQMLYIQLVSLRQTGKVLSTVEGYASQLVGIYEKKVEAGDANILELNEANFNYVVRCSECKLTSIEYQTVLEKLVGLNGGKPLDILAGDFGTLPELPAFDELYAEYMELSPELQSLAAGKKAAGQDVKLSRSQSLPKLSVGYKREFGSHNNFNGVTAGMSIPVFGNRNNVKRARAQEEYADALIESATLNLHADLRGFYLEAQTIRDALARYNEMPDVAEAVEAIQKALDAGRINITEYFSQLEPIYDAHIKVVEMRRDYLFAYAQLNMIRL